MAKQCIQWRATRDCSKCQGTGLIIMHECVIRGKYWNSWVDCDCVLQNWNKDFKEVQENRLTAYSKSTKV